jgi:thiol-disulfide isomerase/thioredoxin
MKNISFQVLPLILVFFAISVFFQVGRAYAATDMPAFTLPEVTEGKIVDTSQYSGKVLLVVFFATWCPPCMEEVPELIDLQKEFGREGFSVLGLSVDEEGPQVVSKMVQRRGINYPVVMANGKIIRDFGGVYSIPVSFLVNKKGVIVKKYPGLIPHDIFVNDIKAVIK